MEIKTQEISTNLQDHLSEGDIVITLVLPDEIKDINIEHVAVKGPFMINEQRNPNFYNILLILKGNAILHVGDKKYIINNRSIARIPYNHAFKIEILYGENFCFFHLKKVIDEHDYQVISSNSSSHVTLYLKEFDKCPIYTEDIKSRKTINRMMLPEGLVPRFCMGSVETTGPDIVQEHEHPMLDQLFFGLDNCKCTCIADDAEVLLEQNMMLHIPLGSTHSVSVDSGSILSYIWFDIFFSNEGEKYMKEQHSLVDQ